VTPLPIVGIYTCLRKVGKVSPLVAGSAVRQVVHMWCLHPRFSLKFPVNRRERRFRVAEARFEVPGTRIPLRCVLPSGSYPIFKFRLIHLDISTPDGIMITRWGSDRCSRTSIFLFGKEPRSCQPPGCKYPDTRYADCVSYLRDDAWHSCFRSDRNGPHRQYKLPHTITSLPARCRPLWRREVKV
jgi:hypothetical protein